MSELITFRNNPQIVAVVVACVSSKTTNVNLLVSLGFKLSLEIIIKTKHKRHENNTKKHVLSFVL